MNLGAYVGQTVDLQIRTETDRSLISDLFVDDISLQPTAAAAAAVAALGERRVATEMKPTQIGPQRSAVAAGSPERVFQRTSPSGK